MQESREKSYKNWSEDNIYKKAKLQKSLLNATIPLLAEWWELIYSTCTLAPEENEMIVNNLLEHFDIELEQLELPLKFREGITEWEGKTLSGECKKCLRLYPQDNDTDGFFVTKIKKLSEDERWRLQF